MRVRVLSDSDVAQVDLAVEDYIAVVRDVWRMHGQGPAVLSPPKSGLRHADGSHIMAMPATIVDLNVAGLKWVAYYPQNKLAHRPAVSGIIVLNELRSGSVIAILNAARITARRTAAMTCVALDLLAVRPLKTIAIIGTGSEAATHIEFLGTSIGTLDRIVVAGRTYESASEFCGRQPQLKGVDLQPGVSTEMAVRDAQAVVTATDSSDQLLKGEWLTAGVTLVLIDSAGKEVEALAHSDRVIVDDLALLQTNEGRRRFPAGVPKTDGAFGDVIRGRAVGRNTTAERITAIPFGIGACDVAVADRIFRRAAAAGVGCECDV